MAASHVSVAELSSSLTSESDSLSDAEVGEEDDTDVFVAVAGYQYEPEVSVDQPKHHSGQQEKAATVTRVGKTVSDW